MDLGDFEIMSQLSVGSDGARFDGLERSTGRRVEVRILAGAKADATRWKEVRKRLRLLGILDHPAALSVFQFAPEHEPPFVVTEPSAPSLAELPLDDFPWKVEKVRAALRNLGDVLREAHRLGLAHGRLSPRNIHCRKRDALALDFADLDLDSRPTPPGQSRMEEACRAPESRDRSKPQPTSDLFALGVVVGWLWRGKVLPAGWTYAGEGIPAGSDQGLPFLVESLLSTDPLDRISAQSLVFDLVEEDIQAGKSPDEPEDVQSTRVALSPLPDQIRNVEKQGVARRLGRYQLEELLGEGGLGQVFRAVDSADGTIAAIKILHAHLASRPVLVKRFHKEARLLAELNNPFIVNLLEHNHDGGVHYLALEFIRGPSLNHLLKDPQLCPTGKLPEPIALGIVMDVARALADAHRRGIIHRDIKPQNIMILRDSDLFERLLHPRAKDASLPAPGGAKLCDFGLARHVVESESLHLTSDGTAIGTPLYMSPEQSLGKGAIGAATDVYALGATLYHLLAGRPPFIGETALALSLAHANEPPSPLRQFNAEVSEGICRIVERCLAKKPETRFADGADLLDEIERLIRGEPSNIVLHPQYPTAQRRVQEYSWVLELRATPDQLWPYVANTERVNRAAGLAPVDFAARAGDASVGEGLLPAPERYGSFRKAGVTNAWREHPFEWIEGRRFGVLREYTQGVFVWLASTVTLESLPSGGTRLTHHVRIEPRSFLGKIICAIEVGVRGRRSIEKVYQRIDAYLAGQLDVTNNSTGDRVGQDVSRSAALSTSRAPTGGKGELIDAFEKPAALTRPQKRRLTQLLDKLIQNQTPPHVVGALEEYLQNAADQDVARIRPLALAKRLDLEEDALIHACLIGTREGLFTLLWDIVCPLCRIPSGIVETLKELKEHGYCEACQADFPVDFASSVELIFRVHPSIRTAETRTYCVGGPAHSPHVVAQIRLAKGETFHLDLSLAEGIYRLRGPQLPQTVELQIDARAVLSRLPLQVPDDFKTSTPREPYRMQANRQRLTLTNLHSAEVLLRIERTTRRPDALTAARASTLGIFRQLFPGEILESGKLVSVASMTFLAVDLGQAAQIQREDQIYKRLGESKAFSLLHDLFEQGNQIASKHNGTVLRTVGDGMLLAFDDRLNGVRAALDVFRVALPEMTKRWPDAVDLLAHLRAAVHHGSALATTINDRLDYFGATVQQTLATVQETPGHSLSLTSSLASDPEAVSLLRDEVPMSRVRVDEIAAVGMVLRAEWEN